MKTYVASNNAGKLGELRAVFAGSPFELQAYGGYASPSEDAADYLGNALLKARALARELCDAGIDAAVLADDSGLEVDALDGRPGVYSARYAGADASWEARRASLLAELLGVLPERRSARFVCAIAVVLPDGRALSALGSVGGRIVEEERGSGGFGYDPLFLYPPRGCTFAELSSQEKNAVSHRRVAANALLAQFRLRA